MFWPSKKIIYLIAGIGTAGLLLFFLPIVKSGLNKNQESKFKIFSSSNQELIQKLEQEAQKDSDNDGLKDWEEALWKTDPLNPDTDKDNTLDGEEIRQNRDPLKAGPNDQLPDLKIGAENKIIGLNSQDFAATNLTGQIAKTLGFKALSGAENKNFSVPADSELLDSAAEKTLADFTALFHPQISENELIVINDNSEKNFAEYLQSFSKVIAENPLPKISQEEAFLQAVQDKDFSNSNEYLNYYQKITWELKEIPAPKTFVSSHKRIIELLLGKIVVLENLKEIERDPLKTIIALQEHEKINEEIRQLMNKFADFFKKI
ncbi:MAG: hypothetical protein HYW71_02555 [Candidatus Niyogibacteria bacterium]|nr:hypothetical protein [Candidatus Niyogibacteria bacterium]